MFSQHIAVPKHRDQDLRTEVLEKSAYAEQLTGEINNVGCLLQVTASNTEFFLASRQK